MPCQRIKFYQTGSFSVGNRLLRPVPRDLLAGRLAALAVRERAAVASGVAAALRAIGHGKKAARSIDAWLWGSSSRPTQGHAPASFGALNTWYYADAPGSVRPRLEAARRITWVRVMTFHPDGMDLRPWRQPALLTRLVAEVSEPSGGSHASPRLPRSRSEGLGRSS
jgi:hypothetical protein